MTILIFTEGTILMHKNGLELSREQRVYQSKLAEIEKEQSIKPGSIHDYASYIPIGDAVGKIKHWEQQKATIFYLTSRRTKEEIKAISNVLKTNDFPDCRNLLFRKTGENYKDVVERLKPDVYIEDDCESIGGKKEMTSTHLNKEARSKIKIYLVKEFKGIDNLPENLH